MEFLTSLKEGFSTIAGWGSELFDGMLGSTPQGFLGVSLIFIYFVIMMAAVVMRIRRAEHVQH